MGNILRTYCICTATSGKQAEKKKHRENDSIEIGHLQDVTPL